MMTSYIWIAAPSLLTHSPTSTDHTPHLPSLPHHTSHTLIHRTPSLTQLPTHRLRTCIDPRPTPHHPFHAPSPLPLRPPNEDYTPPPQNTQDHDVMMTRLCGCVGGDSTSSPHLPTHTHVPSPLTSPHPCAPCLSHVVVCILGWFVQYGDTALIRAAYNGHDGCVDRLVKAGANVDAVSNVSE